MDAKNLFDAFLEAFRVIVREEIREAMANGKRPAPEKEWLSSTEAAELYGLPKTWFESRGRSGDIARAKPGRRVLFKRRDVEAYLEKNKRSH